jgi:hypothetical protein
MSMTMPLSRVTAYRLMPGALTASHETAKFVCGLTKTEAEVWLDWLESNGHQRCELSLGDNGFAVWFV